MSSLVNLINKEKHILDKMIENNYGDINSDLILKQSKKVDKYIVEYLRYNSILLTNDNNV